MKYLHLPIFRLRTWLTIILVTAIFFVMTMVVGIVLIYRLPKIEAEGRERAQATAEKLAQVTEQFLSGVEQQLLPLASLLENTDYRTLHPIVEAIVADGETFNSVSIVDFDGKVVAVGVPRGRRAMEPEMLGIDLSGNSLFRRARAQPPLHASDAGAVWSDSYLSVLSADLTTGLAMHAGRFTVVGEVNGKRLVDILHSFHQSSDPIVSVIDGHGKWLASTDPTSRWDFTDFSSLTAFAAVQGGRPLPEYESIGTVRFVVGAVKSKRLGWVFGAGVPIGWANPSYRITVLLVLVAFGGATAVAFLIAPIWASGLARPIHALVAFSQSIASGDYRAVEIPQGSIVEFNRLGRDLGKMGQSIQMREAELRGSEERLRATLENTPSVAIQWYDLRGKILYWNSASTSLLGFSPFQAVEREITESPLIHGSVEQATDFIALLASINTSGTPLRPTEFAWRDCTGRRLVVLATIFSIRSDKNEPIFVCMAVDITDRKRAEAESRENQNKLAAVFNASPAAMSVSDITDAYRVIDVNEAWTRQFKRTRECAVGRNGVELGLWEDDGQRAQFLQQIEADQVVHEREAWLHDGQGARLLCRISALCVLTDRQRLLVMVADDITAERRTADELRALNVRLEERVAERTAELSELNEELSAAFDSLKSAQAHLVQSEKLAALGQLVAGIAHELNTPIGNALLTVTTLRDREVEFREGLAGGIRRVDLVRFVDGVGEACEIGGRNLTRAAELITSFKQVAIDQTSDTRRRFNLAQVVREIVLSIQPMFKPTPFGIEVAVDESIALDSYPGAIGQVITNLLTNALVHGFRDCDHGTIHIIGGWLRPDIVSVEVIDDGCGIPSEIQHRIFEPFFTTRFGCGGSGLGLNIVFNLVTGILGGTVDLDSVPGEGSRFRLRIPVSPPVPATV